MEFGFSAQDQAFRAEVTAFLDREVTPEIVAELETGLGPGSATRELYKKMGTKGWLTVTWPRQYGGMEGTNVQRLIVGEELGHHRAYYSLVGATMAGPTILLFGSEELKQEFLPRISAGESEFALGYTEPEAGSDLAALDIRAVDDGDDFIINGQKIFNTATHYSQYHWLGARTDPEAPKHRGVSLIVVDLKSPGITISPLWALTGRRTNVVYYQDVRVPKRNLVGERGRGFYHIATALDFERMFPMGDLMADLDDLVACLKEAKRDGVPVAQDPLVRQRLGEMAVQIEALRLLSYHIAWLLDRGTIPNYQSSMLKLFLSETRQRFANLGVQILGPLGQLRKGGKWTQVEGRFAHGYLEGYISTIVGGTSEVQRNIIATRGLGLPRT